MSTLLQTMGLKIYLDTTETQDTDIGLYTTCGTSWFKWIENDIDGLSGWKSGIISAAGVPDIVEEIDASRSGGLAIVSNISVSIDNTAKFYKELNDLGVSLNNLRCEIIEIQKNLSTVISETVRFRGVCKVDKWTEQSYEIPIEPAILNRKSNLANDISSADDSSSMGAIYPLTFGQFIDDRHAKIIRTINDDTTWGFDDLFSYLVLNANAVITFNASNIDILYRKTFPIVSASSSPSLDYTIQLGLDSIQEKLLITSFDIVNNPSNLYLFIASDTGAQQGKYRRITKIEKASETNIKITINSYFEVDPANDANGNGAWVSLIKAQRDYVLDFWECGGFRDANNALLTIGAELYVYANENSIITTIDGTDATSVLVSTEKSYFKLPVYAYDIVRGDTDYNKLSIQPIICDGGLDSFVGYLIIPWTYGSGRSAAQCFYPAEDMSMWVGGYTKIFNGLFNGTLGGVPIANTPTLLNVANVFDKDSTTYADYEVHFYRYSDLPIDYYVCFEGILPPCPDNFSFDAVYLGLIMWNKTIDPAVGSVQSGRFLAMYRKFIGSAVQINDNTVAGRCTIPCSVGDLPDFYFTDDYASSNQYFYVKDEHPDIEPYHIAGYKSFLLPATNADELAQIYRIALMFRLQITLTLGTPPSVANIRISELALIFEKRFSIDSDLFTTAYGRIFGDTWGLRKTSADTMDRPGDLIEHVCRLQNFADNGKEEIEYGQAYAANALIKTSGDGSFDASELNDANEMRLAFQVLDKGDAWSDVLKERLCTCAWLANYVDESGYECIRYLPKTGTSPTDEITLADVPLGYSIGEMVEPNEMNIFCEPVVKYAYDYGAQKFTKELRIRNSHLATYDATAGKCTIGFSEGEATYWWQYCHDNLWSKYRFVQEPPSNLSERPEITRYDDACWYFEQWVKWMTRKRNSIPVPYNKAFGSGTTPAKWHIGRHVNLTLPHQTNNVTLECCIEKIVKSFSRGIVDLGLIFLDDLPADFYIHKVLYTNAQGADLADATKVLGAAEETIIATM